MAAARSHTNSHIEAVGFTAGDEGFVGATPKLPTVSAGSTKTLTSADAGKLIQLNALAGSVVTLPAATGSGNTYHFTVSILATSNSHKVQVANGTDVFGGAITTVDNADATTSTFGCAAGSDTITLNRGTTGSVKLGGDYFTITDVAAGFFNVRGVLTGTGGEATPFSAAVS